MRAILPRDRLFGLFLLATAATLAVAYALFESNTLAWHHPILKEGYFVQESTALLFLLGFLLGLLFVLQDSKSRRAYLWIPLASAFSCLEEISYGEGYLYREPPTLLGKHVDTVHDLADVALIFFERSAFGPLLPAACLLALAWVLVRHRVVQRCIALAWNSPIWRFFFVAALFGLISELIDLKLLWGRSIHVAEEVLEMDGAAAMLIAAALIGRLPVASEEPVVEACAEAPGKSGRAACTRGRAQRA